MKDPKCVEEIVTDYLEANGFDGLVDEDGECWCKIGGLLQCHFVSAHCTPGYLWEDEDGHTEIRPMKQPPEPEEKK